MTKRLVYPRSFPTQEELDFLRVLLCPHEEFFSRWNEWSVKHPLESLHFSFTRLLPFVYRRLVRGGHVVNQQATLRGIHKATWAENQLRMNAVVRAASVLREIGIPVMVLKGLPLLATIYNDMGARASADGDILVHPSDALRAMQYLINHGWSCKTAEPAYRDDETRSLFCSISRETTLVDSRGVELDLHWAIFGIDEGVSLFSILTLKKDIFLSQSDVLWECANPWKVQGVDLFRPCFEDMLLHVLVHGSFYNEGYHGFRWVLDASILVRSGYISWPRFLERAKVFRRNVACFLGLRYLHENGFATIPEVVLRGLEMKEATPRTEVSTYYRSADRLRLRIFGNIPLLWYGYWRFVSRRSNLMVHLLKFPSICLQVWGVTSVQDFLFFLMRTIGRRMMSVRRRLRRGLY